VGMAVQDGLSDDECELKTCPVQAPLVVNDWPNMSTSAQNYLATVNGVSAFTASIVFEGVANQVQFLDNTLNMPPKWAFLASNEVSNVGVMEYACNTQLCLEENVQYPDCFNGQWDDGAFTNQYCQLKSCDDPGLSSGLGLIIQMSDTDPNENVFHVGSSIALQCDYEDNYILGIDETQRTVTCDCVGNEAHWSDPLSITQANNGTLCSPVTCATEDIPAATAYLQPSITNGGQTVYYSCDNDDYALSDANAVLTCPPLESHSDDERTWEGVPPTCELKQCPQLQEYGSSYPNGHMSGSANHPDVGSTLTVDCDDGYRTRYVDDSAVCTSNSTGPQTACEKVFVDLTSCMNVPNSLQNCADASTMTLGNMCQGQEGYDCGGVNVQEVVLDCTVAAYWEQDEVDGVGNPVASSVVGTLVQGCHEMSCVDKNAQYFENYYGLSVNKSQTGINANPSGWGAVWSFECMNTLTHEINESAGGYTDIQCDSHNDQTCIDWYPGCSKWQGLEGSVTHENGNNIDDLLPSCKERTDYCQNYCDPHGCHRECNEAECWAVCDCNVGYYQHENGTCVPHMCDELTNDHGTVTYTNPVRQEGSVAGVICEDGYDEVSTNDVVCTDGNWTNVEKIEGACVLTYCSSVEITGYTGQKVDRIQPGLENHDYSYTAEWDLGCASDYTEQNPSVVYCDHDTNWKHTDDHSLFTQKPICTPEEPNPCASGSPSGSPGGAGDDPCDCEGCPDSVGVCTPTYTSVADQNTGDMEAIYDGTYTCTCAYAYYNLNDEVDGVCHPKTCPEISVTNSESIGYTDPDGAAHLDQRQQGSKLIVTCLPGFDIDTDVECENGGWIDPPNACEIQLCDIDRFVSSNFLFRSVQLGTDNNNASVGAIVQMYCPAGYVLTGYEFTKCYDQNALQSLGPEFRVNNTYRQVWSSASTVCIDYDACEPNNGLGPCGLPNEECNDLPADVNAYGAECVCKDYFVRNSDGQCVPVQCPMVGIEPGCTVDICRGNVSSVSATDPPATPEFDMGPWYHGSQLGMVCAFGYELVPEGLPLCVDGTWSTVVPTCEDINACDDYPCGQLGDQTAYCHDLHGEADSAEGRICVCDEGGNPDGYYYSEEDFGCIDIDACDYFDCPGTNIGCQDKPGYECIITTDGLCGGQNNTAGRICFCKTDELHDPAAWPASNYFTGYMETTEGDCVDIDECENGQNMCGQYTNCVNKDGRTADFTQGYTCECQTGDVPTSDLDANGALDSFVEWVRYNVDSMTMIEYFLWTDRWTDGNGDTVKYNCEDYDACADYDCGSLAMCAEDHHVDTTICTQAPSNMHDFPCGFDVDSGVHYVKSTDALGGRTCTCKPESGGTYDGEIIKVFDEDRDGCYNPCEDDPCVGEAHTVTCLNDNSGDNYECVCEPDYGPVYDEVEGCPWIDNCTNVECQNGGNCTDLIGNFTCECPPRFYGMYCEYEICDCCEHGGCDQRHCNPDACCNGGDCLQTDNTSPNCTANCDQIGADQPECYNIVNNQTSDCDQSNSTSPICGTLPWVDGGCNQSHSVTPTCPGCGCDWTGATDPICSDGCDCDCSLEKYTSQMQLMQPMQCMKCVMGEFEIDHDKDNTTCNDGNYATDDDTCWNGVCVGVESECASVECDVCQACNSSSLTCVVDDLGLINVEGHDCGDQCSACLNGACSFTPMNAQPCNDSDPNTYRDECDQGDCEGIECKHICPYHNYTDETYTQERGSGWECQNQDGLERPCCEVGNCTQVDAEIPNCPGGDCDQSDSEDCVCGEEFTDVGRCNQTLCTGPICEPMNCPGNCESIEYQMNLGNNNLGFIGECQKCELGIISADISKNNQTCTEGIDTYLQHDGECWNGECVAQHRVCYPANVTLCGECNDCHLQVENPNWMCQTNQQMDGEICTGSGFKPKCVKSIITGTGDGTPYETLWKSQCKQSEVPSATMVDQLIVDVGLQENNLEAGQAYISLNGYSAMNQPWRFEESDDFTIVGMSRNFAVCYDIAKKPECQEYYHDNLDLKVPEADVSDACTCVMDRPLDNPTFTMNDDGDCDNLDEDDHCVQGWTMTFLVDKVCDTESVYTAKLFATIGNGASGSGETAIIDYQLTIAQAAVCGVVIETDPLSGTIDRADANYTLINCSPSSGVIVSNECSQTNIGINSVYFIMEVHETIAPISNLTVIKFDLYRSFENSNIMTLIGAGVEDSQTNDWHQFRQDIHLDPINVNGRFLHWEIFLDATRFPTEHSPFSIVMIVTVEVVYAEDNRRILLHSGHSHPSQWYQSSEFKDFDMVHMQRWLQAAEDPGYEFQSDFLVLPFMCMGEYTESGVSPGQYAEVPCPDGDGSMFVYCDNDGWDMEQTKGYCEELVEIVEPEAAIQESEEDNNTVVFIVISVVAFVLTALVAKCCFGPSKAPATDKIGDRISAKKDRKLKEVEMQQRHQQLYE